MGKIFFSLVLVTALLTFSSPAMSQDAGEVPGAEKEVTELLDKDHGNTPWTVNIEEITMENTSFREVKWTGKYIQMTLMSIPVGGQIGWETHPFTDQFIRIESGKGRVMMGVSKDDITFDEEISNEWVFFIPAGYWHNLYNTGEDDLKLYSIYGPPQHLSGTIHKTFEEAEEAHHD